ncbi:MAG: DUF3842 family protein [Aristaeellaceae bacterium]
MRIAVMDGQGGRLGQSLVERILAQIPDADIIAVGLNIQATKSMMKGGAQTAATGENAAIVACRHADVIVAPLGMAIADSLWGEVSPAVAAAVGDSSAHRVLIPMNMCKTYVPGVPQSSAALIQDAIEFIKQLAGDER